MGTSVAVFTFFHTDFAFVSKVFEPDMEVEDVGFVNPLGHTDVPVKEMEGGEPYFY